MSINLRNFDGQELELKLKGNFFDRNALITWNDTPVARIDKSFLDAGELIFDAQTYYLTVAPHGEFIFLGVARYLRVASS
jgi:hypothetical protein